MCTHSKKKYILVHQIRTKHKRTALSGIVEKRDDFVANTSENIATRVQANAKNAQQELKNQSAKYWSKFYLY